MSFAIRLEENEDDRAFIRGLNARLSNPIEAPAHSQEEVVDFQDRFTASAWTTEDGATFIAVREDGLRLGYVNVRGSVDEIANERCGYVALLAVVAEAEGEGVGQSLLCEAEKWCVQMGFSRLALDVFASNRRALQFYDRAGFRPETIRVIKRL